MIKLVVCLKRKSDLSLAEFSAYWKERHGPLFLETTAVSQHVTKYVQSHTLEGPVPGFGEAVSAFDGFAEIYFDNAEDMAAAFGAPEYSVIRADERQFLDLAKCRIAVVEEVGFRG